MSRQSSPVPYTFGWNIWLMNLTPGGLFGYASSKCMTSLKVPSSKGVSAGPMMTAFLINRQSRVLWLDLDLRWAVVPGHDVVGDG